MKWGGSMGIYLIARDNIKKKKGNAFILLLMVALAILLLYVGISVLSNMDQVVENKNEIANGADYFMATTSTYTDDIMSVLQEREEVKEYEKEQAIYLLGVKYYNEMENQKDAKQLAFLFLNKDANRSISQINVKDEGSIWKKDSIILPYYMKVGMGYKTGDTIHLKFDEKSYDFEIFGFSEDIMFSTPTNISTEKCYISKEVFQSISDTMGGNVTVFKATLNDAYDAETFEADMINVLNKKISDYEHTLKLSLNYDMLKYGTSITANIFMAILSVFAILLILIALVIIHFNINNSIESNIKNIGLMQASGYTSRQLGMATLYEFLMISMCGVVTGLLIANAAGKAIGNLLSASIGLSWQLAFDLRSALISTLVTIALILLAVIASVRKFKKITPLDALRNGIHTHNFKKNWIKMDRSSLPLNCNIGLKNILYHKKKNVMVCMIIVLLCFCTSVAICIYYNFAVQDDKLIQITGFEVPDITATIVGDSRGSTGKALQDARQKLDAVDEIKYLLEYSNTDIACRNGENEITLNCDIYSDTKNLVVDNVVEGKRPEYENEIMLSTIMAGNLSASIGDVVYLHLNGVSQDYLLVGLSQGIEHIGKKAMITTQGMKRLNETFEPNCLYIYLKDESSINQTIKKINTMLMDDNIVVANYKAYVSDTMESIVNAMKVLCVVLLIAVVFVIAMTLLLLIKTQLVRDRKTIGIYKALGYTTGQLMMQTTMSYTPVVFVGAVIGCIVAWFGINPSFILCLSAFGIKKCSMSISIEYLICIVIMISLWAELIVVFCSLNIRKILPYEMIQEE